MGDWHLWMALGASFLAAAAGLLAVAGPGRRAGGRHGAALREPARELAPPVWRLVAPLASALGARLAPMLSMPRRHALLEKLLRAGLDRALAPEEFVAGRVLSALACAAVAALAWLPHGSPPLALAAGGGALGWLLPAAALRDRIERRRRAVLRQRPFVLDLVTLAIESGMNLTSALAQAVEQGPAGPLRAELARVLRDVKAGRPRAEALRALADRLAMPEIASLVAALVAADRQGASLAPILRAQAEQRRTERFLRAEKMAMEAPVKMLFPLVVFIFPGTFAVLLFPVLSRLLSEGFLR